MRKIFFCLKIVAVFSPHTTSNLISTLLWQTAVQRGVFCHVPRKRSGCTQPSVEANGLIAQHRWISFISYHILWPTFLLCESLVLNQGNVKMVYA
jgi:hypothetical protein